MPVDKSWITSSDRSSPEYEQGLNSFIKLCEGLVDSKGNVRCACAKCYNTQLIFFTKMKYHMYAFGLCPSYTRWVYHGERIVPPAIVVDDDLPRNDMAGIVNDIMEERTEEDTNLDGTRFSSLDFLAKLMLIKVKNKWTNSSFNEILELLKSSHPEGNTIPPSHYIAKKRLKNIGLGYESIDVCKNDCALFWKEHHSLQNCPVCNESRWVDTNTKGKKVPHKVLRYFPLTPRLRRLYCSRHTAKDMTWHSTGRAEEGTMRHPVDGFTWKEIDKKYPNFSSEPRNVRLGLAADGLIHLVT
ncbi:uncharacterized protein LOC143572846 [Bidens hawaiensis]|uniref:uncharacterized protein LOC143572846 n=1 Tax=Bidens hawaiensis TaxID=980011 RepID=UPI00404978A1